MIPARTTPSQRSRSTQVCSAPVFGVGPGPGPPRGRGWSPSDCLWGQRMGSKPQPFKSSPAACNGTFGKDTLSGLVMSLSGGCAILKLRHRLRGERRMSKKVNTSNIGRQQGNQGRRTPKERRRPKINGSFPWTSWWFSALPSQELHLGGSQAPIVQTSLQTSETRTWVLPMSMVLSSVCLITGGPRVFWQKFCMVTEVGP